MKEYEIQTKFHDAWIQYDIVSTRTMARYVVEEYKKQSGNEIRIVEVTRTVID